MWNLKILIFCKVIISHILNIRGNPHFFTNTLSSKDGVLDKHIRLGMPQAIHKLFATALASSAWLRTKALQFKEPASVGFEM